MDVHNITEIYRVGMYSTDYCTLLTGATGIRLMYAVEYTHAVVSVDTIEAQTLGERAWACSAVGSAMHKMHRS